MEGAGGQGVPAKEAGNGPWGPPSKVPRQGRVRAGVCSRQTAVRS